MTRVRRARGVAAVLTTLAAAALATSVPGGADAATPRTTGPAASLGSAASAASAASTSSAAPKHTHLVLHVTGCDSCRIQAQHAVEGRLHVWQSPTKRVGSDHQVAFDVRSSLTQGMSFTIRAPWEGNTGAVSNIVTRYAGHAVDSAVSRAAARNAARAEGCWAGTTVDDVRLDLHVARVRAKTLDGRPTHIPLAYATHSLSSWRPMARTLKGTIGNQDAFWCTTPPSTTLTFTAPGCDGCQIGVMNGARRVENTWSSPIRTVQDGRVRFSVPRDLTRGISATVYAPWEGNTGYTALVSWRYAGHTVGSSVSLAQARAAHRGSPCWGGTGRAALTVPLTVHKVRVAGNTGPTDGTLAFARVTQSWLRPMERTGHGILGTQEVIACRK